MWIGPFAGKNTNEAEKVRQIKDWVRELLDAEEFPVFVTQLNCAEPGCPDLETVIAVMVEGGPPAQYRLFKPISEIVRDDIAALAARPEELPQAG